MNRLPLEVRIRILGALVEGCSIRGAARMTGTAKNTVLRLLGEVGDACDAYLAENVHGLHSERVQCDEIWSYCHAKQRNLPREKRGLRDAGDLWTWTAIDADTKLIVTWHLGKRTLWDCDAFISDLASRVDSDRVQISTDGLTHYNEYIQKHFYHRADHGSETKDYGILDDDAPERKYSPMVVKRVHRKAIWGVPDPDHISTAYVERNNLTMRMSMRRFTRLTNGYSKNATNLQHALALHFMFYNFARPHSALKGKTPAIAAGLTTRRWTLHDLAWLPDVLANRQAA